MPLVTRTRLVIIQHVLEQAQPSNTVRPAAALLSTLEVRPFGVKDAPLKLDDLEGAWLLWPEGTPRRDDEPLPSTLVLLDGSWSQARHMSQRLAGLRGLRKWSLPAPAERRSLRAAPAGGMSTLEALAEALAVLEGEAVASQLRAAHQQMIDKQLADRGYVGPMR
jgi:DTW domain-containing protein YfiP